MRRPYPSIFYLLITLLERLSFVQVFQLRFLLLNALLPLLFVLFTVGVYAEGSRDLITSAGGQGSRPFLQSLPAAAKTAGIARKTKISVYVNAGEQINLGSSVASRYSGTDCATEITDGKDIVYTSPNGTQNNSCDVVENGAGYIGTPAQETNGPQVTGGYTPCKFTATETGIYEIEFFGVCSTRTIPTPTLVTSSTFPLGKDQDQVSAWDVTVFTTPDVPSTEKKGRVFTSHLPLDVGGGSARLYSKAYFLTDGGYLYQISLNGIQPFEFIFFANNQGFRSGGEPLYRSVPLDSTTNVHNPANDDTADAVTHKLFFNSPADDLPDTTSPNPLVPRPNGSTWLISTPPPSPVVSDFKFEGKETFESNGNNCSASPSGQAGTAPLGGYFCFDANRKGGYILTITSSSGSTIYRKLAGRTEIGINEVYWDGLDNSGNPVPAQENGYKANVNFMVDDIHFPLLDVENATNGIILQRLNYLSASTDPYIVYYDSSGLTGGTPPSPTSQLDGVSSSSGAQKFSSNFGDNRGIDLWTALSTKLDLAGDISLRKADLSVTKTHSSSPQPGQTVTYTIKVTNGGPSNATGIQVVDNFPAQITGTIDWTCSVAGTGTCASVSGTGNINTTVDLNSGAIATFTVTGTVDGTLTGGSTVSNSVTITRPIDVANPPLGSTTGDTKTETYTDTFSITPPENLPLPQPVDKEASTLQGTAVLLPPLEGIDHADTVVADDLLRGIASYTITTLPPNGVLRLGSATGTVITVGQVLTPAQIGTIYFVPNASFIGTTTFNYIVTDLENAISDTALDKNNATRNGPAIVTITVTANQPPVATSNAVTVPNDVATKLPKLVATDSDGTVVSYTIQTTPDEEQGILYLGNPASGGTVITPGQILTPADIENLYFKPATGFTGTAPFTFTVKDDKGLESNTATVTITVSAPTNPPPPANTVDLAISFSGNGAGNVKSENVGGIDCDSSNPTLSCNSSYGQNTVVKLVPKPAPGSQFVRWDGPEDCQDGQVTLATSTQCTAVFELVPVNLTVTIVGQGSVTSSPSGIDCDHNTESCKQGFSRNSAVTLTAKPASGWRFQGWEGDCDNQGKVTMSFDRACRAVFVSASTPTVPLTVEKKGGLGSVTSKPGTINCGTLCQNDFSKNSLVELTATPEPGYKFTGWSGDCSGTGNPTQVTMDAAKTCIANFTPLSAPAKLEVTIIGQGRVESNPLGMICDQTTTPCYQSFDAGTPVNLAVIPDVGWHFEGWVGDCTQSGEVTVVSEQKCQALFVPADEPHVDLFVKISSGNSTGTVTSQPGEINCGTLCDYGYARGVIVRLTATPKPGYRFVGWGGNCSGTDNPTTVLMDMTKTCTANFVPATSDDDDGDGTPSEVENGVPNKDGNNDGVPDSKQPNVVSLPTPDGNYVTVVVNENCKVNEIKVVTQSVPEDGSYQYPYVLDYDLGCTETEITVYYHGVPSVCDKTYRQYSPLVPGYPDTVQWQNLAITCGTVQIDNRAVGTANFRLKDGGSGDNSGKDGQIKHFSHWAIQSGHAKFSSPTYMVDEFGNAATITVQRIGGCEGKLTVDYQTQDMTATTPADYTTSTGSITWEDGDCSDKTFMVPVIDDLLKEGNETVRLLLFKGTENIDEAVLTIVDNETSQPPTDPTDSCYNLPACNVCCSSCKPNESSNLIIKSLVVTIKVGQTMNVLLAEGKGPLVIQEIPNSTFVSLDDWKPITNGVGEVVLTGVSVGNTKMVITDSANTALQATLYINVIPDENAENLGIRSILTTIRVGQTLDMVVAGGKGTLSLTEIPSASFVSLDSWEPLGDTGTAAFSLTGVKVGDTKLVMRDESTPPQWVTVTIKVVSGSTTGNQGDGSGDGTIPDNYLDNSCTMTNAVAMTASGQSLNTQDCFRGRINSLEVVQPNRQMLNRRQAKDVEVLGKIIVEPNHVGQIADILMVGIHKTFLDHQSFMRNGEEWIVWDEEIGSLTPAQTQVQLPDILEVPIYHGPLDSTPGEYVVYLGYRLQDGTIVYNGIEPIHFYVGNGASIDMQLRQTRSAEVKDDYSTSSYEVDTNSYFEPLIQNQDNELGNYLIFPYTDMLRVSTFVRVDSEHVGRPADILMAAAHFRSLDQVGYKYDGERWSVWDNRLESLRPVNHYHTLPATLEIPVYPRNLTGPGEFVFYVGYRLENGVTVFNGFSPIHFIVANGLGLDAQGRSVTTTARFASWTYQNGYAGNPFQATVHRPVSLKATIVTDRNHVGQVADVLMVAIRQPAQASYHRELQQWGQWDERLVTLKAAMTQITLEPTISEIPIFEGNLNNLEGSYVVYVGYRLADSGTIIYNGGETLQLNVH